MFLHIGSDQIVFLRDLIGIFDIQTQDQPATREYIKYAQADKKVIDLSGGPAKSWVVTSDVIYVSPISSTTLKKRADNLVAR